MKYTLQTQYSPNFTPGSQSRSIYGLIREIICGAGHWWGLWQSGYTHAGVVNTFMNAARQASAHEVISDSLVTVMVRSYDIAWATNSANPYTYSYEVDPQIMHRWRSGASAAQKTKANRIFETVAQRMADTGRYKHTWYPHKKWFNTACNDIRWNEIVARAKQIKAAESAPAITWKKMDNPREMVAKVNLRVINLTTMQPVGNAISSGKIIDFETKADHKGVEYLRTAYSTTNKLNHGIRFDQLKEKPAPDPEWVRNMSKPIELKLFVLPAAGTPVINLNTNKAIPESVIPKGTAVDVARTTKVSGKTYYITSYSVKNAMPNGVLADHLGVPVVVPPKEKPEWLKNLEDIKDVVMYTRAEVPVVNLLDGSTVGTVPINTAVDIATATEWHGQKYLITKWSASEEKPHGILAVHLDSKSIEEPEKPIEPAPEQPTLDQRLSAIEAIIEVIRKALAKIGIKI